MFNLRLGVRLGLLAVVAGLTISVAACGGDDDDDNGDAATATPPSAAATEEDATEATATTESNGAAGGETVEVSAVDYAFEGLPDTLSTGTTIELTNESDEELHEFVAIRLPDDEDRPVSELVQLPDEELGEIVNTEPAMVLIAPPGEEGMAVLGDGTFTEAGRYAVVCFVPVGADPQEFMEAAEEQPEEAGEESGPPEVAGGPPHAAEGMYAEVLVEE